MLRAASAAYVRHFRRHDPTLHAVVRRVGPCTLKAQRNRFGMLVRSIISQQISIAAARSIRRKLEQLAGPGGMRPQRLAAIPIMELRRAGLSPQKAAYVHDLAAKCEGGTVRLATIGRRSDEEVIAELTQVKGIGRWTAQMFLIFSLARPNVFPVDDFGVRAAIRQLDRFAELPTKAQCLEIGERWSPFASIGSWYCWRFLDLQRSQATESGGYPV